MSDRQATQAVHDGEERRKPYGALTTPIVQTSTYTFADTAEIRDFMKRKAADDPNRQEEYGRYGNPTQGAVERKLAVLEGGECALLFASGMCAITTTLLTLLSAGDHLIAVAGLYRRTREFIATYLPRWGIETTFVGSEAAEIGEAIRPTTRLLFLEAPTNPHLRVPDVERIAQQVKADEVTTVIDATFSTPVNLRPLALGVDVAIHSATKYLGGHNDLLAGAVVGPRRLLGGIEAARGVLGGVAGPHDAYLLLRGMKSLPLRVHRQNESAQRIAEFLEGHPAVSRVYYPGLASHPDHRVAARLMSGFGGVVSFEVAGGMTAASRCVDRLRIPYVGPTLGGVESIVQQQALLISLDEAQRHASGISDALIRFAVGIEDTEDLIEDLRQALEGI